MDELDEGDIEIISG
jgi:hypothetical protein